MERNFPIILSELRKEKGLSQKDAAAKLGIGSLEYELTEI